MRLSDVARAGGDKMRQDEKTVENSININNMSIEYTFYIHEYCIGMFEQREY